MRLEETKNVVKLGDKEIEFSVMTDIGFKNIDEYVKTCALLIKNNQYSPILYSSLIAFVTATYFTDVELTEDDEENFKLTSLIVQNIPSVVSLLGTFNCTGAIDTMVDFYKQQDIHGKNITIYSQLDGTLEALELLLLNASEKVRDFDVKDLNVDKLKLLLQSNELKTITEIASKLTTTRKKTTKKSSTKKSN